MSRFRGEAAYLALPSKGQSSPAGWRWAGRRSGPRRRVDRHGRPRGARRGPELRAASGPVTGRCAVATRRPAAALDRELRGRAARRAGGGKAPATHPEPSPHRARHATKDAAGEHWNEQRARASADVEPPRRAPGRPAQRHFDVQLRAARYGVNAARGAAAGAAMPGAAAQRRPIAATRRRLGGPDRDLTTYQARARSGAAGATVVRRPPAQTELFTALRRLAGPVRRADPGLLGGRHPGGGRARR
jgi:hypothetical protein